MTAPLYEVLAIKYAELPREARLNFIDGDAHETQAMPLDYFVWVVRNQERTIVVDTGFTEAVAKKRKRKITNPVAKGLKAAGVDMKDVRDVVITHLHYDHCGNDGLFPNARYHLQDDEMAYATGRHMGQHALAHAFDADYVGQMLKRVYAGRVEFHDGDDTLAPGVTLHRLGGHTMGLQVVRVETAAGPVVLASDASHFYAHFEQKRVFPVVYNIGELLQGYATLHKLAGPGNRIIPGHDPLVFQRYPAASKKTAGWIARLDRNPR
jgi:glyoxylase-like metal-dependent hydrolase (beta-lactamase superfamily II)